MTRQITALLYRAKEYGIGKAIPINADECLKMCRLINDLSDELESISKNTNNDAQAALHDVVFAKFGEGKLNIAHGTYDGNPAVFIQQGKGQGVVGDYVPDNERLPTDKIEGGSIVLLFPTLEQSILVENALCNTPEQQQPDAELLAALEAAKWKGEPSGNPEKGWVTTSSGQRFTSLGSRKMYGKFLQEHNKQIDYIIARAEQYAIAQQQPVNAALLEALKYAHSQMQPFCDDTIVKQAIARAEQKGGS